MIPFLLVPRQDQLGQLLDKTFAMHHIEKRNTILTPQSIITALRESLQHTPVQLAAKAA
jgi:hypothetical protein